MNDYIYNQIRPLLHVLQVEKKKKKEERRKFHEEQKLKAEENARKRKELAEQHDREAEELRQLQLEFMLEAKSSCFWAKLELAEHAHLRKQINAVASSSMLT